MTTKKQERFDTIAGSIIFFLIMGLPILMLIFGVGESGVQPLGKTY